MTGRRDDSGHVLVLALLVLLVVSVSSALLGQVLVSRLAMQQREVVRVRLDLMVDGVVAETLAGLARDPSFAGVMKSRWGAAEVWSRVEREAGGVVRIEAGASLGSRARHALLNARVGVGSPRILTWVRSSASPPAPR